MKPLSKPSEKKPEAENNAVKHMLPPGMYLDPQLSDDWSEKDIESLGKKGQQTKGEKKEPENGE